MKTIIVKKFGGPEVLTLEESPTPSVGANEVLVRLTSVGLNHADLMAREGQYRLSSGEPPFIPGLEGGGIIEKSQSKKWNEGDRVIIHPIVSRLKSGGSMQGTYRTHIVLPESMVIKAPDALPNNQLGAIWLTYLTAWGCLKWKHNLQAGQFVGIPAASSGVGLAAAQVVRSLGGIPIGLTTGDHKKEFISGLKENQFEHIVVTHNIDRKMWRWDKELMSLTGGNGIDVFFDPVASGDYFSYEIRALAQKGTIWIYGLLQGPDVVDLSPLIRKHGAIRGWLLSELLMDDEGSAEGISAILQGFESGTYQQHLDREFLFDEVQTAHEEMEKGKHTGKLVLIP